MTQVKGNKKRIFLSILLAAVMVLTAAVVLPMAVDAAGTQPTLVTSSNYSSLGLSSSYVGYYAISTANELVWFADYVNSTSNSIKGVLRNDIDLTGVSTRAIMTSFSGIFDGRNYSIIGMNRDAGIANEKHFGFIQTLNAGGTVKNVVFDNAYVDTQSGIGNGIIAYNNYGTISGCMVVNSSILLGNYVGLGLIAGQNLSGGVIENCGVANSSIGRRYGGSSSQTLGGITQINNGTVKNCYTYNIKITNGTSANGALIASGNAPTNSYYYTTSTTVATYGTAKSAEAFDNGAVAVLLGSGYGQDIDTWNVPDEYPVVGGPALYAIYYCHNSSLSAGYSNTSGAKGHLTYSNGFCTNCGAYEPGTRVTSGNYSSLGLTADHEGYWALGNAGQLYWCSAVVKGNYNNKTQNTSVKIALTANITVNSNVLNSSGGLNSGTYTAWTPIGDYSSSSATYTGTFDGNGKTVSGLYFNNSSKEYIGLFGYTNTGSVIKNVGVVDSYFSGDDSIGGIVGCNGYGTVTGCYNTSTVIGGHNNGYIGGVVGFNSRGSVTNCYNTGSVTGTGTGSPDIGGIVGCNRNGTVTGCYNTGALACTGTSSAQIGGVVGSNYSTVTGCYYLTGTAAGGIDGADVADRAEAKNTAEFASGEVAYLLQGSQSTQLWGQNVDNGGTREYYPVFSSATVYAIWYCDNSAIVSYSNTEGTITHSDKEENYDNGFCTSTNCDAYQPAVEVTSGNYTIGNAGQLYWFAAVVNSGYGTVAQNTSANGVLVSNITVNSNVLNSSGGLNSGTYTPWTPIGNSSSSSYKGAFDGNGKTISGLYYNGSSSYIALFGRAATNSVIKNVGVVDSYFSGSDYIGGVVGSNSAGTVTGCYNTGTVIGGHATAYVGGVVGYTNGTTVTNCYNTGAVTCTGASSPAIGGIVGYNSGGTVTGCYNTGALTCTGASNLRIGGVVGYTSSTTVTNCYYLSGSSSPIGGINGADAAGQAEAKTAAAFASGEVAYLLQGSQSTKVWGQNIDNGSTAEALPVLSDATVYAKWYCDNSAIVSYTNTAGIIVHVWNHNAPAFAWAEDYTSLTVTLTCTNDGAHTLSDTTTDISVDTTDPDWTVYTGTVVLDSISHTSTKEVENEIISVYISWTEFTFIYTIEWNPETLQYEGTGWTTGTEGGGEITVTNEGNVDVDVSFEYVKTIDTVDGSFTDEAGTAVTAPFRLTEGASKKVKLTLSGDPGRDFASTTIGTVTTRITRSDT